MDKEFFPSEVYHQGMLRLYARYLGVDEKKIFDMLKMNNLQETAVEFDVINLHDSTQKKRKKVRVISFVVLILTVIIVTEILFRWDIAIVNAYQNIVQQFAATEEEVLEKIDGFYERSFKVGDRRELISGKLSGVVELVSIEPIQVKVNGNLFQLELNSPIFIDIDENDNPEYVLLVRLVDTRLQQGVLRFDPNITQPSITHVITEEQKEIQFLKSINPDGAVIDIEIFTPKNTYSSRAE